MSNLHEKSLCCGVFVRRFGGRRRQCSFCHRTWSLYKKKRGRKGRRINSDLARRYLSNGSINLEEHAKRLKISIPALRQRLRQSRDQLLKEQDWLKAPSKGPIIVVVDALLEYINGEPYVLYLVLLKSPSADKAVIVEPQLYPRYENKEDWLNMLNSIPKSVFKRITAFVGDGKPCFISISRSYGWVLQRCHFHLFAELQRFASLKRRSKHQRLIKSIRKHVQVVVTTTDKHELTYSKTLLKRYVDDPSVPARLKTRFLKGFLHNVDYYRSYINHPNLQLPNTSNSCEALCGIIRKFLAKVHGFNIPKSFIQWARALLICRKKINCKSAKYQQN